MHDNAPLPDRDDRYDLPDVRHPLGIDGEPHEALGAALSEYEGLLIALTGYAQRVEDLTRSAMLSEGVTLPEEWLPPGGAGAYPESTYELAAVAKANKAVGMAMDLIVRGRAELAKPVTESRRMIP